MKQKGLFDKKKQSKETVNKISVAFHMCKGGYSEETRDTGIKKSS